MKNRVIHEYIYCHCTKINDILNGKLHFFMQCVTFDLKSHNVKDHGKYSSNLKLVLSFATLLRTPVLHRTTLVAPSEYQSISNKFENFKLISECKFDVLVE